MRRARLTSAFVIVFVAVAGALLTLGFSNESLGAELGTALLGGGVVGGAFVAVESMLLAAADRRSEQAAIRRQLTSGESFPAIDLSHQDLSGIYLPNRILVRSQLSQARLRQTSLQFCDLRWAIGVGCDFTEADLSGANLSHATLTDATLRHADLTDTSLRSARLRNADLRNAVLRRTDLTGADLTDANLDGAMLRECILDGATLPETVDPTSWHRIRYDDTTSWPKNMTPPPNETVTHDEIGAMDLLAYLEYREKVDRR